MGLGDLSQDVPSGIYQKVLHLTAGLDPKYNKPLVFIGLKFSPHKLLPFTGVFPSAAQHGDRGEDGSAVCLMARWLHVLVQGVPPGMGTTVLEDAPCRAVISKILTVFAPLLPLSPWLDARSPGKQGAEAAWPQR